MLSPTLCAFEENVAVTTVHSWGAETIAFWNHRGGEVCRVCHNVLKAEFGRLSARPKPELIPTSRGQIVLHLVLSTPYVTVDTLLR